MRCARRCSAVVWDGGVLDRHFRRREHRRPRTHSRSTFGPGRRGRQRRALRVEVSASGGDRKTDPVGALHVTKVTLFRADLRKAILGTGPRSCGCRPSGATTLWTRSAPAPPTVCVQSYGSCCLVALPRLSAASVMKGSVRSPRRTIATRHCVRSLPICVDGVGEVKDNEAMAMVSWFSARSDFQRGWNSPGLSFRRSVGSSWRITTRTAGRVCAAR